jgi:hypothetical protein
MRSVGGQRLIVNNAKEKIRWVAAALHEPETFKKRSQIAAADLGMNSIETLAHLFHGEPTPPVELANEFSGLGDWIAARQFAIFEIFYHFGEVSFARAAPCRIWRIRLDTRQRH